MRSVIVGTAGHIDHGKSALVRALTGTDPDRLKEEKARGITIDLGFAHTEIDGWTFSFVDVPGHERFVKNMLAGAGGIDFVVLVVAADESVMPQTREHFEICRLLQVPAGVIALTKADLADAEMLELAALEVRDLVAGSFLERAPIVPVSSRTGAGLPELRTALAAAAAGVRARAGDAAARLPIDRAFSVRGFGTVVTGTLVSGCIRPDDELVLLPGARPVKARGVQVHGERQGEAAAGQRAAINLSGVEIGDVSRGLTLAAPGAFAETRAADADLELIAAARPLRHGARVRFHQGTAEILARVALVGPPRGADGEPRLEPGGRAYVRLRLERPAVLARGDRFILRAYSPPTTIGGGHVLDPQPPRGATRTDAAWQRAERLRVDAAADREARARDAALVLLEEAGAAGLAMRALVQRAGADPAHVEALAAWLVGRGAAVRAGDALVHAPVFEKLQRELVELVRSHHAAQPLSEGVPREEARARLFKRGAAAVFDRAVDLLTAAGTLGGRDRLALASHRLDLSPEEERVRAALDQLFLGAGLTPPEPGGLAAAARAPAAVVERMLALLVRQKVLQRLDGIVFHAQALARLKEAVAGIKSGEASARIDVATFKERFGVTRKFAIPLLEYLDRERVTRRVGDARVVL
ncbi:MAG TPA: selenocysteine-specific translation elongation factor [Vicinamibacterales bacterium]|nr:selenocysteine-specific translation elongation factor [Vicinamibacterales bacterium]